MATTAAPPRHSSTGNPDCLPQRRMHARSVTKFCRRRSTFESVEARQMLAGNILLEDNFNYENGGVAPLAIFSSFANWDVTDGSVDLVDSASTFPALPAANGLFVDLDGSTGNGGRLESKTLFSLVPGDYLLSFELAGPQSSTNAFGGPNLTDSVDVFLGSIYSERFTKAYAEPFTTIERQITVNAATSGRLVFDHLGGDYVGLILDTVKLLTNDAPLAVKDSYSVNEDTPLIVSALGGVLGNDSDVDGDALTAGVISGTAHGVLTFNGDGSFSYTPDANFNGTDSFSYKADDGLADSNIAVVTITVNPVYDPPVAQSQLISATEDVNRTITLTATADNPVHFHIIGLPANGKFFEASGTFWPIGHEFTPDDFGHGTSFVAGPTFTYVGDPDFHGIDSFQFKASDGLVLSAFATLTIDVQSVNDAPVTQPQTVIATEDVEQMITVTATDPDSAVHFHVHSLPANGKLIDASGLFGWPIGHVFTTHDLTVIGGGSVVAGPVFNYLPNFNFNGTDSFQIRASDGLVAGSIETVTIQVQPVNDAPIANGGPDQTSAEGAAFQFSATAADVDGDPLMFFWDFGDGGSAVGETPSYIYADNGIYTVTFTVQDTSGAIATDSLTVTVANVTPTASVTGPPTGVPGQPRTFALSAIDPSSVDQDTGFNYLVDWGDGTPQQSIGPTAGNGSKTSVNHTYLLPGNYTVVVSAEDKDGAESTGAIHAISISVAGLQPDPFDPTKTALAIGAGAGSDSLRFVPGPTAGDVVLTANSIPIGTFQPTGHLFAFGQGGNDFIFVDPQITLPAWLDGGAGNDVLWGGSGGDVLIGGGNSDVLYGGRGRNLLIGGEHDDTLVGGSADDIVIAGTTAYDSDQGALSAIMGEWTSAQSYGQRIANLSGTGSGTKFESRLNGNFYLSAAGASTTVFDDGLRDHLLGDPPLTGVRGNDWFFADLDSLDVSKRDLLFDRQPSEFVNDID